jgi:hypothetical protein
LGKERRGSRRRALELSLARIDDLLQKTDNPARRTALETARAELQERLAADGTGPDAR